MSDEEKTVNNRLILLFISESINKENYSHSNLMTKKSHWGQKTCWCCSARRGVKLLCVLQVWPQSNQWWHSRCFPSAVKGDTHFTSIFSIGWLNKSIFIRFKCFERYLLLCLMNWSYHRNPVCNPSLESPDGCWHEAYALDDSPRTYPLNTSTILINFKNGVTLFIFTPVRVHTHPQWPVAQALITPSLSEFWHSALSQEGLGLADWLSTSCQNKAKWSSRSWNQ